MSKRMRTLIAFGIIELAREEGIAFSRAESRGRGCGVRSWGLMGLATGA